MVEEDERENENLSRIVEKDTYQKLKKMREKTRDLSQIKEDARPAAALCEV